MPQRRQVLLLLAAASGSGLAAGNIKDQTGSPSEKVLGIGGVFFRATDPKALALWYRDHLGI